MTYSVKEIFYTLQGEGFHAGRPAIFAASLAAISGQGLKPTAPKPSATSATPTL